MRKFLFVIAGLFFSLFGNSQTIQSLFPASDTVVCFGERTFFSYRLTSPNQVDSIEFYYSDRTGDFSNGTKKVRISSTGFSNSILDTFTTDTLGTYKFYAKIFFNGTIDSTTPSVRIFSNVIVSNISPSSPVNICENQSVNFRFDLCSIDSLDDLKIEILEKPGDILVRTFNPSTLDSTIQTTQTFTANGRFYAKLYFQIDNIWTLIDSTKDVTVQNPPASPTFSLTQNQTCSPSRVTLTITNYVASNNYEINEGSGWVSISGNTYSQTYDFIGGGTTTKNFQVRVSKGPCTVTSSSQTIGINQRPQVTTTLNSFLSTPAASSTVSGWGRILFRNRSTFRFCGIPSTGGATLALNLNVIGVSNLTIDFGDGSPIRIFNAPIPNNVSHNYTSVGIDDITIIATAPNGCKDTTLFYKFIGTNPQVTLSGPPSTKGDCAPRSYTFRIDPTSVQNNQEGTFYLIESNDGAPSQTFQHPPPSTFTRTFSTSSCGSITPSGYKETYFVKITAINPCSSSPITLESIQLDESGDVNIFTQEKVYCVNTPIVLIDRSKLGKRVIDNITPSAITCDTTTDKYWWVDIPGFETPSASFLNPILSPTPPQFSFSRSGTYKIFSRQYLAGSSCGFNEDSTEVCIQDVVQADFDLNYATPLCSPATFQANNKSNLILGCSATRYKWEIRDSVTNTLSTNVVFNGGTTENSFNPNFTLTAPGVYRITLIDTTECSVTSTDTVVTIIGPPSLTWPADQNYCGSQNLTMGTSIGHQYTVNNNFGTNSIYSWTLSGGNGSSISGATTANPILSLPENSDSCPKHYFIRLNYGNECFSTNQTQIIRIFPPIQNNTITSSQTLVCTNAAPNQLSGSQPTKGNCTNYTYTWQSGPNVGALSTIPGQTGINLNPSSQTGLTYYQRTVTSDVCTSRSDTISVNIIPPITGNQIGNAQIICQGGNIATLGQAISTTLGGGTGSYAYTWETSTDGITYSIISGATSSTYTPTGLGVGTYYFRRIVRSGGSSTVPCVSTSNFITIEIKANPSINVTLNPIQVCPGQSSTVTTTNNPPSLSIASYQWSLLSGTNVSFSNTTIANPILNVSPTNVSVVTPNQIQLLAIATNGCFTTVNSTLNVSPRPIANFNLNKTLLCGGESVNITNTSTFGNSFIYSVTPSTGVVISNPNDSNPTITFPANTTKTPITYQILQQVGNNLCGDAISKIVTVKSRPNIRLAKDDSICGSLLSQNYQLNGSGTFGYSIDFGAATGPFTYQWTYDTNLVVQYSNTDTPRFSFPAVGNCKRVYQVRLIFGNECGKDTAFQNITIFPPIDSNYITGNDSVCENDPIGLITGSTPQKGDCGNYTYQWQRKLANGVWSNIQDSTRKDIVLGPITADITIRRVVFSGKCISYSDSLNIIKLQRIVQNVQVIYAEKCAGDIGWSFVDIIPITGGTGFYQYQWQISTDSLNWTDIPGATNATYQPGELFGNTYFRRLVFSRKCVSTSSIIKQIVHPKPNVSIQISPNASFCSGIIPTATANNLISSIPLNTYSWSLLSSGHPGTLGSPGANSTTITLNPLTGTTTATSTLRLIVTSIKGCKDTADMVLTLFPKPKAGFYITKDTICGPDTLHFINKSQFAPANTISYQVIPSTNVVITPDASGNAIIQFPVNYGNTPAQYSVRQIVGGACVDTSDTLIFVKPKPQFAPFTLPVGVCPHNSLSFTASVTAGANIISNLNWSISPTPQNFSFVGTQVNIGFGENQTNASITYTLTLTATTSDGCQEIITKTIDLFNRPTALLKLTDSTSCVPGLINLEDASLNASLYFWQDYVSLNTFNPSNTNNNVAITTNTFVGNVDRNDLIFFEARTLNGCRDTVYKNIIWHPLPDIRITPRNPSICDSNTINFRTSTSILQTPATYQWSLNGVDSIGATRNNITRRFFNPTQQTTFDTINVVATSSFGCVNSDNTQVFVRPNAFVGITPPLNTVACAPFPIVIDSSKILSFPFANSGQEWYQIDLTPTPTQTLLDTTVNFPGATIPNANDINYIKLVGISKYGCKNADTTMAFRTIPNPVASFTASDTQGCSPRTITFTSTSDPGLVHTWDFGPYGTLVNTNSNSTVVTVLFNNPTNAPITIPVKMMVRVGSGTFQCSNSTIQNIIINPKPSLVAIPNAAVCPFNSISISPTAAAGSPPIATTSFYHFPLTDTSAISTGMTYHFGENQGVDAQYRVTIISKTLVGCADTTVAQLTHFARPTAFLKLDDSSSCVPGFITLRDSSSNRIQRIWSSNNGLDTIQSNSSDSIAVRVNTNVFKGQSVRLDSIFLVVKNQNQCADTIGRPITWHPLPDVQITNQDSICDSNSLFFNAQASQFQKSLNRFSLTWTKNNIQTSTGQFDTTTLPFFNPGIDLDLQKIKLIIRSDYGCTDFLEKSILVKPDAKAFFSSSKYVNCAPFIIPIDTFLQYPTTNSGYVWEKEDATGTWVPISSGTTLPTETLQVANQTLKIRLIAQSKWGCKNDTMVRIYQTKDNPKPFFDFVNDSSGCTPYTVQVRSLSTPAGVTHQWVLPNGVTDSNNSGITNTLVGVNPGNVNQTYTVKLIVGDASSGCKDSVEHPFTVFPLPRPDFSFSNPRYCFPDSGLATYVPLSPPRIDSLLWTFGTTNLSIRKNTWKDTLFNSNTTFIFQDNTSGIDRTDSLKLIAKSFQGCIDSVSKLFIVSTRPISRFEFNDTTKCGPDTASVSYQSLYSTSQIGWSVNSPLVSILNPTSTQPIFGFPKNTGLVDEVYTITLFNTSANGCVDSTKREIKIHPQPRPVYGFSPTIGCGPLTVQFNDTSVLRTRLLWNFSSSYSSTDTSTSFIFPTPFNADSTIFFNLKVVTHFGCEENVRDSVIVRPGPVAKFAVKDTFFCLGNQAFVTGTFFNRSYGSIDTFTWYFGDGDSLITTRDTTVYHAYSKEGIYTVKLKGVNPCGVSTDTFQVEVLEKPKAKFTLTDTFICGPVNLSINNQTTNIQVTYAWEIGNVDTVLPQITPITSTNFNPGVHTLSADILNGFDKKYYVRLIVKNRCASDTLWDTITVRPKPTALFTPNPKTGCAPKFVTLFNNSRGEPNSYQWDFSDTASFTTTTNTIDPIRYYPNVTQPTKYWIKLTATNACGVDFMSDTVLITPNTIQAGMSVISGQKYHCESGNVGFVNTSSGATTFFWDFGDGTTAITTLQPGANVIYHQYSRVGTFVVSMRASNGCSDTTFFDTVYVFPKPTAVINVNRLNFCPGDIVSLTGDSSLNASTYQWNFGDSTGWKNTLGSNPKYVYSTSGSYTISLVVSRQIFDSMGVPIGIFCYDTATVNITIQPIPTAIIGSNAGPNDCSPFLATFNDLSTGSIPSQSLWNFGDGGTGIGSHVSHMYQNWGVFQVQLVVFNALGCSDTAYTNVRVYEGPRAQFTVSKKDSCGPHQVQFTNTTQFTGPQNVLAYEWAIDSGLTGNFTVVSTSKDYNTTFYGSSGSVNPTRYLVRLKVNTNQPCIGYAYDTITIYPKAKATVGINIPDSHCAPFAILPSNVTVNHYADANSSYTWYANDSLISGPKTNSAFPGFQFSFPDSQVTIKLVVQSKNGCSADSSEKTFITYPNPISQFDIDIDSGCTPHFTMIRGRAVPGVVNYQWKLGGRGSFNSGYSSNSKPLLGTNWVNLTDTTVIDTIWLIVRNPLTGCSDTSWKTIKIYPKPHAGIVSRDSLCAGDSIQIAFNGDSIPPAIQSYRWFWASNPNNYGSILRPNDSSSAIQFNTVKGSFVSRHHLKLEVSTIHGCKDTIEKSIFLKPLPVIAFADTFKEICVPATVTFKNDSNQIGASYSWTTSTPVAGSVFNPNSSDSLRLFYFDRQGVRLDTFRYSVTMTDLRGCSNNAQTQVITHPRPLNDYTNLIDTICPGNYSYNNLSVGEQPMTYLWKIDSANRSWTSTSVNLVHLFRNNTINPINYFDTLFSTSAFGCKDTISGNKTVYPKPISSFSSNFVTPSCAPIQLNNSHFTVNTLPTTNVSFQWLVNGSPITAIQAVPNFPGYNFPTPNDSFTVSLVAFSRFNCGSDTESIIFRTHPNPVASFVLDSLQGCSPLQMGATSNSSPALLNHFWSLGSSNGSFIFPSTPTSSPRIRTIWTNNSTSNNNESITLRVVQTTTGCSSSVTQNFVTYPKPQANITGLDSVCAGGFIPLNYNQTPGRALPAVVGGVQWSWIVNQPAATISNPSSTTTFVNFPDSQGVGVTRYQLIQVITTASGCTDTALKDLWMKPRPKVLIASHTSNLCVPFSTTLTNLGTQNGASYTWSSSLGNYLMNLNNPNSSSTLVNFLDRKGDRDTTYIFEVKMTDARGCRDSATTSITTHPRPLTAFTPINDQVCPNTTTTFTNSTIGQQPVTYLWKINQWTSNSSSPTFTFTNPNFRDSTYFDTLISTSVYGCKDTLSGTRIVWYNPKSRIGRIATNHCEPFVFNPVDSSRGHQSFRNRWILTNNGVTVKDVVGINPNFNPIPQSSTPYQLILITTNQYLCLSDTDMITFYVRPKPKAQYSVDTNRICTGAGLIRFTNQSQIFSGSTTYSWNFGDSSLIDTNFSPSHFYSKPRAYWSSLLVQSDYGCIDSASKIIFIGKRAKAEFTADLTKGCDTIRVNFNNLSLFSDSAQWDFGNGLQSSTFSPSTYFTSKPGTYTVTLRAIGMFGCDETIVKPAFIRVYEKPIANFDVDSLEKWLPFRTFRFTNRTKGDPYSSQWFFGDGNVGFGKNAAHAYRDTGWYNVKLVVTGDTTGCVDSITKRIRLNWVDCFMKVPNAFQPEGPSEVNLFNAVGSGFESYKLEVYSSWGELLYRTTQLNPDGSIPMDIGWDGKHHFKPGYDKLLPLDTYIYKIEAKCLNGKDWKEKAGNSSLEKRVGTFQMIR